MNKILVTGGAGFIGSDLVRLILDEEPEARVLVYDLLTYAGNLDNLKGSLDNPRLEFIKGSICDRDAVGQVLGSGGISHVINLAAESHVDRSILGPKGFAETNVLGTVVLLEAARDAGVKRSLVNGTNGRGTATARQSYYCSSSAHAYGGLFVRLESARSR